jgi:hypothetical protein
MDASQVGKCGIRDCRLIAVMHIKCMDASQVGKCGIGDRLLFAVTHIQCIDASQVSKVSIRQAASFSDVRSNCVWEASTPQRQTSPDPSFRIIPSVLCNRLTCPTTDSAQVE